VSSARANGPADDRPDEFPLTVRRFVQREIDGVEQLEILLFLHRQRARSWDAATVAESLSLPERRVAHHLEALGRRGLLDVRLASTVLYRFNPATPELTRDVALLADAYRERRSEVLEWLAPRRRTLKDFSDAFRFTKDRDDG
jgi:DNA-binding transcriptional ArsR family regulator